MVTKAGITALFLCSFLVDGTLPAQAHDHCDRRVRDAEINLRKETRKHGEHSPQAQYKWRQLEEARSSCGYYQAHILDHNRDRDHRRQKARDGDHNAR